MKGLFCDLNSFYKIMFFFNKCFTDGSKFSEWLVFWLCTVVTLKRTVLFLRSDRSFSLSTLCWFSLIYWRLHLCQTCQTLVLLQLQKLILSVLLRFCLWKFLIFIGWTFILFSLETFSLSLQCHHVNMNWYKYTYLSRIKDLVMKTTHKI